MADQLDFFQLNGKEVISLTGGGGKTSLMYALAKMLANQGKRVIVTTTTKILQPSSDEVDRLFFGNERAILEYLSSGINVGEIVGILSNINENCKSVGVSPELIDEIFAKDIADYIIVEADGAARKPFKAPAVHEPVIPDSCSVLINICGIDALNKSLCLENHHRPELISNLTGLKQGDIVKCADMAMVISSDDGGKKGLVNNTRFISLINKVDDEIRLQDARKLAAYILASGTPQVIISSVKTGCIAIENHFSKPVAGIILAAGQSKRMGKNKLFLPWENNLTVLETTINNAQSSNLESLIVVTGYEQEKVAPIIEKNNLLSVHNSQYAEGQSGSLKAGISILDNNCAAMFILGDQPLVEKNTINDLIALYQQTDALIVAPLGVDGKRGNPTIFSPELFDEINNLSGDTGARELFEKYAERVEYLHVDNNSVNIDIDDPEQYIMYRREKNESFD